VETSPRAWLESLAAEEFCYLTTTGRRTGTPHTIEIWFVVHEGALYMLSGGGNRSDWVRNLANTPAVTVRIGQDPQNTRAGTARIVDPAADRELDATIRPIVAAKYQGWKPGQPLSEWARTALAVEARF
jgi:deazaflavin-dependent oxidoreductase (nitroreductase family)